MGSPHYTAARRRPIKGVERVKGIEPSSEAWEAPALPLSYTRAPLMIGDPRLPASALRRLAYSFVAGLGPAIHEVWYVACRFSWMPGTRPGTNEQSYDGLACLEGGSTGTVPISPGRDTSRISRSSEVAITLWCIPPGMKHESPGSSRQRLPSSNSSSTQPFSV